MSKWTDAEIALFETLSDAEISERTGRKFNTVRGARQRFKVTDKERETAYDEDLARASNEVWAKKYKSLSSKYDKAVHEACVTRQLVDEIKDLAPKSYSIAPAIKRVRPVSPSTPQAAVLLLSDTHVGKVV